MAKLWSRLFGKKQTARSFDDIEEFREFAMAAFNERSEVESVAADANDRAKFSVTFGATTSTADITNIFGYMKAYPNEDVDRAIERFVNSVLIDTSSVANEDNLVAVIRNGEYVDQALGPDTDALYEHLGADLWVIYMIDRPDSMAPARSSDFPDKDLADIRTIALKNVRQWLPNIVSDDGMKVGSLFYVEDNTMLSTSLILLDEFWNSISARFPNDVLIGLPRKDQLFVFDDGPKAEAGLRYLIDVTFKENFNLLSPMLYARRQGKIVDLLD